MASPQFVVWREDFLVGMDKIDDQHKRIFNFVNDFYQAMTDESHPGITIKILDDLLDYTKTHFAFEEHIMQKSGFPELVQHKKYHEKLVVETQNLVNQYRKQSGDLSYDVFHFLKSWWSQHILQQDHKYKPFLGKLK